MEALRVVALSPCAHLDCKKIMRTSDKHDLRVGVRVRVTVGLGVGV
jgi:hypothetical protein